MKYLYLYLNIGSFIIPFLFSFHPKLQFYKKWPALFTGIFVMMCIFIPWDVIFTASGIWGFNPDYLSGIYILNLPLEEWLFFICIPYACIFTICALKKLIPGFRFSDKTTGIFYISLVSLLIIVLWYRYDRWYTLVNFIFALLILGWTFNYQRDTLSSFFSGFLIILLPFFLINGVLTGSWIEEQVVWYNNEENLGIRIGTIPAEDIIYALGMLLTVYVITELPQWKKNSKVRSKEF